MSEITAAALTTFEVAPDGGQVRIGAQDAAGSPVSFVLPTDCLRTLIMTLPRMMSMALRAQSRDSSLRLTYPIGHFRLEQSTHEKQILTLATPDGFEVSFLLSVGDAADLADVLHSALPGASPVQALARQ